jgi:hypothetical protein
MMYISTFQKVMNQFFIVYFVSDQEHSSTLQPVQVRRVLFFKKLSICSGYVTIHAKNCVCSRNIKTNLEYKLEINITFMSLAIKTCV